MKRRLKLQVQISVDGFAAGPKGEMDWMVWNWDDQLKDYVNHLTDNVDYILLGRKLAEGFIPHWQANPQEEGAGIFNKLPKIVFSKTLKEFKWENTVVETGDLVTTVSKLKKEDGADMIVYGGAGFVGNLIQHQLIDDFYLFINPVFLGKGMSIFKDLPLTTLKLKKAVEFECGISLLNYELRKE